MASSKNKRRSRKARQRSRAAAEGGHAGTATAQAPARTKSTPRAAENPTKPQTRRAVREERVRQATAESQAANRLLGTYGDRPISIFAPVPVSELCIFLGMIAVVVGAIEGGGPALVVGVIVCVIGVLEFTVREHFSGYRSHSTLLAAFPAVVVEILIAMFVGRPNKRLLLLLPVIPIFAFSFWLFQRNFRRARQSRVRKSPR